MKRTLESIITGLTAGTILISSGNAHVSAQDPEHIANVEIAAMEITGDVIYARADLDLSLYRDFNNLDSRFYPAMGLGPDTVIKAEVINDDWVRLLPDFAYGTGWYHPYSNGSQETYIKRTQISEITMFDPITLYNTTQNQDKIVVVIRNESPEALMIEGDRVVARYPVVLGGSYGNSSTPLGDHRIFRVRGTRHMPSQNGVGFTMYVQGGNASHESPWWDWYNIMQGFYGSHGCINNPDPDWHTVNIDGNQLSVAHFQYLWASTNINYNESEKYIDEAMVDWNELGYRDATGTVRYIIVPRIEDLLNFPLPRDLTGETVEREGMLTSFQTIINEYNALKEKEVWVLPSIVGENVTLTEIPFDIFPPQRRHSMNMETLLEISSDEHLSNSVIDSNSIFREMYTDGTRKNRWIENTLSLLNIENADTFMSGITFHASELIDNYLISTRKGSWGTTIIRYDESSDTVSLGNVGIISSYRNQNQVIIANLGMEEVTQIASWQPFINLYNAGYLGDDPEYIYWQLNNGGMRALGEITQHSALGIGKSMDDGSAYETWTANTYTLLVLDREYSPNQSAKALEDLRNTLNNMELIMEDGSTYHANTTTDFLSDITNTETLYNITVAYKSVTGYEIWDMVGIRRSDSGLLIPPNPSLVLQTQNTQ